MSEIRNLYETLGQQAWENHLSRPNVPTYIKDNIRFELFEWQKTAVENLITYDMLRERQGLKDATHLMFNMATGSGKTLVMASLILYYYKQGYRHFIFFVNQRNIVDKTENNFVNTHHNKYLFSDKIVIDDMPVNIKKVNKFSAITSDIQIKFTSIQQLYNDVHVVKENQTTLEDLSKLDIVMLADEAHHLNTLTSSKDKQMEIDLAVEMDGRTSKQDIERKGWEYTVKELILNRNGRKDTNRNVLLEFTATLPNNDRVAKKYADKTIIKFGLKEFLAEGFTKEINLISTTLDKEKRILFALLFAWYRYKISIKYNIPNFKSVMLLRSKTIEESRQDYDDFISLIADLNGNNLRFIEDIINANAFSKVEKSDINQQGLSRTEQLYLFIKNEGISYSYIAEWIKNNYQRRNIIITNSESNTTKSEKTDEKVEQLLNSLESNDNHVRAIFTVERLTEGWDVLNLYDIVRLYQGQNAGGSSRKTPEATTREKQLIGRGVRYYPFNYENKIPNKRKFDEDPNHELRILEELFYHTYDEESRYISHLKEELRKDGYIRDERKQVTFDIKSEFKNTNLFKTLLVWHNTREKNPNRQRNNIEVLKQKNLVYEHKIPSLYMREEEVNLNNADEDTQRFNSVVKSKKTISRKLGDIETHIFNKAINIKAQKKGSLYQFEHLSNSLLINDISELQNNHFSNFSIVFVVESDWTYEDITNKQKLKALLHMLDDIENYLKDYDAPHIGGEFKASKLSDIFSEPKTKIVNENNLNDDLSKKSWFILDGFYGTSEEKALVEFIDNSFGNLEEKYENIYLLRNEEVLTIHNFQDGRGFQPDFLLFMTTKDKYDESDINVNYQIFIEPKGNNYVGKDNTFTTGKEGWKEAFLREINDRYGKGKIISESYDNYTLIGLPFFNEERSAEFKKAFIKELDL